MREAPMTGEATALRSRIDQLEAANAALVDVLDALMRCPLRGATITNTGKTVALADVDPSIVVPIQLLERAVALMVAPDAAVQGVRTRADGYKHLAALLIAVVRAHGVHDATHAVLTLPPEEVEAVRMGVDALEQGHDAKRELVILRVEHAKG